MSGPGEPGKCRVVRSKQEKISKDKQRTCSESSRDQDLWSTVDKGVVESVVGL